MTKDSIPSTISHFISAKEIENLYWFHIQNQSTHYTIKFTQNGLAENVEVQNRFDPESKQDISDIGNW